MAICRLRELILLRRRAFLSFSRRSLDFFSLSSGSWLQAWPPAPAGREVGLGREGTRREGERPSKQYMGTRADLDLTGIVCAELHYYGNMGIWEYGNMGIWEPASHKIVC